MENFIKIVLLCAILLMLVNIRIGMEKLGNELVLTKVTKVEHIYNYDVDSYGTIKLNDKLVELSYK